MKRFGWSAVIALSMTMFLSGPDLSRAQSPPGSPEPGQAPPPAVTQPVAPAPAPPTGAIPPAGTPVPLTIQVDKTTLSNGGSLAVTGTAPPGKPVYLEVWSEKQVRASRFDSERDKDTGKIPYILYMTHEMPAYYKIFVPKDQRNNLDKARQEGRKWSYSQVLKDMGADAAYSVPAKARTDRYQATLLGSVVGSRGELLPAMDEKENRRRSMQLVKARFRSPEKVIVPSVDVSAAGTYTAKVDIDPGSAPGIYYIRAVADKDTQTQPITVQNQIGFPNVYLSNAGTSVNVFGPFLLSLAVAIFGVLMGAGGGFILNPLLISIWPLPHTVVAGTVMPTVLFSQGSGIYNYSKIGFISWKLGVTIGIAMLLGGFIGPKLTEMITLDQYRFIFGWILIVLAGLMLWQTTPGYLSKNKKEQAILKEFKRKAEESAAARAAR